MKRIIPIFLIAMLLMSCSGKKSEKSKAAGVIDGNVLSLRLSVNGVLDDLRIQDGQQIEKGDTLAVINHDKIVNQITELEIQAKELNITKKRLNEKRQLLDANIEYFEKQMKRLKRLREVQAVPGDNLDQVELKLLEAKTNRFDIIKQQESLAIQKEKIGNKSEYLELMKNDHFVVAPVSGRIIETYGQLGENMFPRDNLADILDESSLFVQVFLEAVEIGKLSIGQKVDVIIDGQAEPVSGKITWFGNTAEFSPKYIVSEKERQSLLYEVKVAIDAAQINKVKIGMPVTVVF